MRYFLTGLTLFCSILSAQQIDSPGNFPDNTVALTATDVFNAINTAAHAVNSTSMVIAVVDRQGNYLGVFHETNAPATGIGNYSQVVNSDDLALALARTAAFFSNSDAPLSSRTVRFITGIHFPPTIMFTDADGQYGIENTNRGCNFNTTFAPNMAYPLSLTLDGKFGLGILTGKKDIYDSDQTLVNPGGIPLYKGGRMVGGIGITGVPGVVAEFAALVGSTQAPMPLQFISIPPPGKVIAGGISLPFVDPNTLMGKQPQGTSPLPASVDLSTLGNWVPLPVLAPIGPHDRWSGKAPRTSVATIQGPQDSPQPAPEGFLVTPKAGPLGGLSAADVMSIVQNAVATADQVRAVIRLPPGTKARFVISVSDLDGQLLTVYRMRDSTIFSIDVSITKSRNVIYFSGASSYGPPSDSDMPGVPIGTAVTNRTINWGSQPLYAPGIDFTAPGPFFQSLFVFDVNNPCTQGAQVKNPYQSGIVFFSGSVPLYRNGRIVGGLGVSGDGVDQDDFVSAAGAAGFEVPANMRADQVIIRNNRLPYQKFPRNPTQ
jgi:uncharacterized protein GlcG (DUF336 family)